jgi:hypothetical protein
VRRKREEIEARLEQERKLREEQELRWHQEWERMFAYMQGLSAAVNYQPPPMVPWPPPGAAVTPVSMNVFACMCIR